MSNQAQLEADSAALIENVLAGAGEIGTMPQVTVKIIDIVENPRSTMQDLQAVIRNDPVLATRILKVVNSALYGLSSPVANIDRAIVLLGLSAVKNIAIAASMTQLFTDKSADSGLNAGDIWRHSIAMAVGAKLTYSARKKPGGDEAFLTGLISDLGLLIERQAVPDQLAEVVDRFKSDGGDFCTIERSIMGFDHQQVGATLATRWRFPAPVCDAMRYHHDRAGGRSELCMSIRLSDILTSGLRIGFCPYEHGASAPRELLSALGLSDADVRKILEALPDQFKAAETIFDS